MYHHNVNNDVIKVLTWQLPGHVLGLPFGVLICQRCRWLCGSWCTTLSPAVDLWWTSFDPYRKKQTTNVIKFVRIMNHIRGGVSVFKLFGYRYPSIFLGWLLDELTWSVGPQTRSLRPICHSHVVSVLEIPSSHCRQTPSWWKGFFCPAAFVQVR